MVRCLWNTVLLCPYIVPKELDENMAKLHFPALRTAFPLFPWSAKVDRQCGDDPPVELSTLSPHQMALAKVGRQCGDDPAVELSTLSSHQMAHPGVVSHLCSLFSQPKGVLAVPLGKAISSRQRAHAEYSRLFSRSPTGFLSIAVGILLWPFL